MDANASPPYPFPADIRREYARGVLLEASALPDPIAQFDRWFSGAIAAKVPEANAMTLATADGARGEEIKGTDYGDEIRVSAPRRPLTMASSSLRRDSLVRNDSPQLSHLYRSTLRRRARPRGAAIEIASRAR